MPKNTPLTLDLVLPDGRHVALHGTTAMPLSEGRLTVVLAGAPQNPHPLLTLLAQYDLTNPEDPTKLGTTAASSMGGDAPTASPRPTPHSQSGMAFAERGESTTLGERKPVDPDVSRSRRNSVVRRGGAAAQPISHEEPRTRGRTRARIPSSVKSPTGHLVEAHARAAPREKAPAAPQESRIPRPDTATSPTPHAARPAVAPSEIPTQEMDDATLREAARRSLLDPAVTRSQKVRAKTIELITSPVPAPEPLPTNTRESTGGFKPAPAVGIDFGSTYCRIGVFRAGLELISDAHERLHVPVVFPLARGRSSDSLLGDSPQGRLPIRLESLRSLLSLGSDARVILSEQGYAQLPMDEHGRPLIELIEAAGRQTPVTERCRDILNELRVHTERHLRGDVRRAVLTVPSSWGASERRRLEQVAQGAGFEQVSLLPESVAALIAHGFRGRAGLFGVYNLGGTFEFSVVESQHGRYRVVCAGSDPWLGGRELDERIAQIIADQLGSHVDANHVETWSGLLRAAEQAKRALVLAEAVDIRLTLPSIAGIPPQETIVPTPQPSIDVRVTIPREQLERAVRPLIRRSLALIKQVLEQAELAPTTLDELVLIGGAALMPVVRKMVAEFFDRAPRVGDADIAVVRGAAIYASELETKPHSTPRADPAVSGQLTAQYDHAAPIEICPSGTPLPFERLQQIERTQDDHNQVHLRVYGEGSSSTVPKELVQLCYTALPGTLPLRTCFSLDTADELQIATAVGGRSFLRSVRLSS